MEAEMGILYILSGASADSVDDRFSDGIAWIIQDLEISWYKVEWPDDTRRN